MAEIKKLLDDAIETEINNLNSASDKDKKSEVIKNLAALHKLRIEEIKTETEIEEKSERRAMDKAAHDEDATLKAFQLDENTLDRYAKIGIAAAELVLPLMFYGVWMSRGLRFEETGTFMVLGAFVTLNDFYDFLGISHVEGGDVVGWLLSDSMYWIDFDNSKAMVDDGLNGEIPCYVVDAEFGPQPESAWDY